MKNIFFILIFALSSIALFGQSKKKNWTVECNSCELKEVKNCQSCANPIWTLEYVDGVTIGGVFMQYPFKSLQANKKNNTIRIVDFNNSDKTFSLQYTIYPTIETFMDEVVDCIDKCSGGGGTGSVSIITDNGATFTHDNGNGVVVTIPKTIDTDTQLSEAEVDAFVSNNGYITSPDDADADPTNELITSTVIRNDSVFVVENSIEHFTGINSGLPSICPAGSLLLYNGTMWTCYDTTNLVTTNTTLFTVNAGTTTNANDNANGEAIVKAGEKLHLFNVDGTININVSQGSGLVEISAAEECEAVTGFADGSIVVNDGAGGLRLATFADTSAMTGNCPQGYVFGNCLYRNGDTFDSALSDGSWYFDGSQVLTQTPLFTAFIPVLSVAAGKATVTVANNCREVTGVFSNKNIPSDAFINTLAPTLSEAKKYIESVNGVVGETFLLEHPPRFVTDGFSTVIKGDLDVSIYDYYAFPTIAKTLSGKLIMTYMRSTTHTSGYFLEYRESRTNGASWGEAKTLISFTTTENWRDPMISSLSDGTIVIFSEESVGKEIAFWKSTDEGLTFVRQANLTYPTGAVIARPMKAVETTNANNLILPMYYSNAAGDYISGYMTTSDQGVTWSNFNDFGQGFGTTTESYMGYINADTLINLIRDNTNKVYRTISTDDGANWSALQDITPTGWIAVLPAWTMTADGGLMLTMREGTNWSPSFIQLDNAAVGTTWSHKMAISNVGTNVYTDFVPISNTQVLFVQGYELGSLGSGISNIGVGVLQFPEADKFTLLSNGSVEMEVGGDTGGTVVNTDDINTSLWRQKENSVFTLDDVAIGLTSSTNVKLHVLEEAGRATQVLGAADGSGAYFILDGAANGDNAGGDMFQIKHLSGGNAEFTNRNNGRYAFTSKTEGDEKVIINGQNTLDLMEVRGTLSVNSANDSATDGQFTVLPTGNPFVNITKNITSPFLSSSFLTIQEATGGYFRFLDGASSANTFAPTLDFKSQLPSAVGLGGTLLGTISTASDVKTNLSGAIVIRGRRDDNTDIQLANILNVRNNATELFNIGADGRADFYGKVHLNNIAENATETEFMVLGANGEVGFRTVTNLDDLPQYVDEIAAAAAEASGTWVSLPYTFGTLTGRVAFQLP